MKWLDALIINLNMALSALSAPGTNADVTEYIRMESIHRNIDPNIALTVARSEGLVGFDPRRTNGPGDHGTSFGPFQLHYNRGLGDKFTAETGLDARNSKTWRAQVDWTLDFVRYNGWGMWHGAALHGIRGFHGISGYSSMVESRSSKPKMRGSIPPTRSITHREKYYDVSRFQSHKRHHFLDFQKGSARRAGACHGIGDCPGRFL